MHQITVNFPEETSLALKLSPQQLGKEIKIAAAVKFYELGKLSSGAAAQLAGISKPLFLTKLVDYGVSTFSLSEEELLEEHS
jgi:predicted HTH domain antitoxin